MLATFLIGLREGLEAALVVGILVAYLTRLDRRDVLPRMWAGVGAAVLLALVIGAALTFGAYALTFQGQEIIGGTLSLVTVAMVTWMIFWMRRAGRTMKAALRGGVDRALATGTVWALVLVGFVSVAREGIETTLLLWSMVQSFGDAPSAILGAALGLAVAVLAGWLLARGAVRLDLSRFFTWTGGFLVIVAGGVLAYALSDLQEAGVLPGPFTAVAPLDAHGSVLIGLAGLPFGWAFDLTATIRPDSALAVLLQATVGFLPRMSWLQVIAWALYLVIVGALFVRGLRRSSVTRRPATRPAGSSRPSTPAAHVAAVPATVSSTPEGAS
ncbi:iron uptake transporter permease EfeU [Microbacterium capsulatum]|uniref:Iron uptake transporter permease EfeU n=1 Tax=Microbacterium capsulatum TaxID=3041921 RepID=A0ABU0XBD8_9MICO|nr:iron uptake transporter permease EfeU [Microbacterium sp. ASV81]MDQ4212416.1 iron uptake transporter permease EfeU [Microbacterium sp. ASV81]